MKAIMSPFEDYFLFQLDQIIKGKKKEQELGFMVDSNQRPSPFRSNVKYINDTTTQVFVCTYLVYLKDCIDTIKVWVERDEDTDKYTLVIHYVVQIFDDSRLHSTKYHLHNYHKNGYLQLWALLTNYRYEALRNISLVDRAANLTPNLTHPVYGYPL